MKQLFKKIYNIIQIYVIDPIKNKRIEKKKRLELKHIEELKELEIKAEKIAFKKRFGFDSDEVIKMNDYFNNAPKHYQPKLDKLNNELTIDRKSVV